MCHDVDTIGVGVGGGGGGGGGVTKKKEKGVKEEIIGLLDFHVLSAEGDDGRRG